MDCTVIGDCVNLASRLEAITKLDQVGIIVSDDTALEVGDVHPLRELDTIRIRGRQRPARIFQVLTPDRPVGALAVTAYSSGRKALAERRWAEALEAFEAAAAAAPGDYPSVLMRDRARILVRTPPPANWDGVWESLEAAGPTP